MKVLECLLLTLSSGLIISVTCSERAGKLLPVFQVVRFPNDGCTVSGGAKNGTCYTAEECSNKGGVNAGSCASGFGVCCTFTVGCGSVTSENCTYFDSATTVSAGACSTKVCKLNNNICQMRLDFNSFVITGPATVTTSIGKSIFGEFNTGGNTEYSTRTQCLTDTFHVTNQLSVPVICGTNSGYHVYFDASDDCNELLFQLGNAAINIAALATRAWSIKIQQYACDYENLAPSGCTQYHYGTGGTGYVYSFNYGTGTNLHLAKQIQTICVRRESGNCKVCWFADAAADVGISKKVAMGVVKGSLCCGYKTDGKDVSGYDCLMIPGAIKNDAAETPAPSAVCGSSKGLFTISAAGAIATTICSKSVPFRITFQSDAVEVSIAAAEAALPNKGFKLRYIQTAC